MQKPASSGLRFGIMCNGTVFAEWEAQCIRNLIDSRAATPALLIIDQDSNINNGRSARFKKLKKLSSLFWYLYSFFFVQPKSKALRVVDLSQELEDVAILTCSVVTKGKFSQYFKADDLEEMRRYNLDFVLRFGFNIIRGEVLSIPKYGVWSFHHDDEEKYRGGPACFWEIYHHDYVTGAILQRLTNRLDGGIVLRKGYFQTDLTSFSANRDAVYFDSTIWPTQVCKDILNGVGDYAFADPSSSNAPIFYIPTNGQMLKFWFTLLWNKLSRNFYKLFYYWQWNIGVIDSPAHQLLEPATMAPVNWLPQPVWNKFYADPFAVQLEKGELVVLFEDLDYKTDVGTISAYVVKKDKVVRHDDVLKLDCHLSYPYLLEVDEKILCIPETCGNNEVALFSFEPEKLYFEKQQVLIPNLSALDSTIFFHEGFWWLLATDKNDGPNHKLLLWYAEDIKGPWVPHANNPVKTDVRSSRPAGAPFYVNGELFRPAQDSSKSYGGRTVINKIQKLSPTQFSEESVSIINPYPEYPDGIHTVSVAGDKIVIDGVKRKFIGANKHLVNYKLKKLKQAIIK